MLEIIQTYGIWAAFFLMMGLAVWSFADMTGRSQDGCCSHLMEGTAAHGNHGTPASARPRGSAGDGKRSCCH